MGKTRKAAAARPAARRPVLLVTGFGPFENYFENPSGDIAELVDGRRVAGVRVAGLRVPVSWRDAWEAVRAAAREYRPHALLCLGVAPEPFFRLEVMARNMALPAADVEGEQPQLFELWRAVPEAPPAYWTTLPVDWLEERLRQRRDVLAARGEDGPLAHGARWPDAGYFLCNHVFFHAMHFLAEDVPHRVFVHVPPYAVEGGPGLPRREVLAAGLFLVEELARWVAGVLAGQPA